MNNLEPILQNYKLLKTDLQFSDLASNNNTLIKNILDKSTKLTNRLHIIFNNNHILSIVRGLGTYGAEEGLFEIMALTEVPNSEGHNYYDPIGYCDITNLNTHIKYIGNLPTYIKTEELKND